MAKEIKELTRDQVNAEEDALINFQFALIDAMHERGMTKAELAEALGVTRARVSQLFSAAANPTIKLAARALHAVGLQNAYCPISSVPMDKCVHMEDDETRTAGSDVASPWFGEVVQVAIAKQESSVKSASWFACQYTGASTNWSRKDGRVANSNGNHAMDAA